jgi:hypothetical protein
VIGRGALWLWNRARPAFPALPYPSREGQASRTFYNLSLVLGLGLAGFGIALLMLRQFPGRDITESILAGVFWPVLLLQIIASVVAHALTVNTVNDHIRRQTWEQIRASQRGVELTLRLQWMHVFYRLRRILIVLAAVRLMLVLSILRDLGIMRFEFFVSGAIPHMPLMVSVLLLAVGLAASILLPLTGIGLDAAVGLCVSTIFRHRVYTAIAQVVLAAVRFMVVAVLIVGIAQFSRGEWTLSGGVAFLLILAFAGVGDWGLLLLNLDFLTEMWAAIPYGVFLGLAVLVFAFVQALLTDRILSFTIYRADRQA